MNRWRRGTELLQWDQKAFDLAVPRQKLTAWDYRTYPSGKQVKLRPWDCPFGLCLHPKKFLMQSLATIGVSCIGKEYRVMWFLYFQIWKYMV